MKNSNYIDFKKPKKTGQQAQGLTITRDETLQLFLHRQAQVSRRHVGPLRTPSLAPDHWSLPTLAI